MPWKKVPMPTNCATMKVRIKSMMKVIESSF